MCKTQPSTLLGLLEVTGHHLKKVQQELVVSCLFSLKDDNEQFKKIKKDKSHCLSDAA
jgi:hypothetical protein